MIKVEKEEKNNKKFLSEQYRKGLLLFLRFSSWVVGPVILGSAIGLWLDSKFDKEPFLFLVAIGISFLVSSYGLIREASKEYKKIEKEFEEQKRKKRSEEK